MPGGCMAAGGAVRCGNNGAHTHTASSSSQLLLQCHLRLHLHPGVSILNFNQVTVTVH